MSKKPKKSRHKVPVSQLWRSDPITPEYQAEVDRSTERLQREYEKALKAKERAERRRERAEKNKRIAEEQRLSAAKRRKAEREYEQRLREYEDAYNEFKRMERMVTAYPIKDNSRRRERVFVTSGRENPRGIADLDQLVPADLDKDNK